MAGPLLALAAAEEVDRNADADGGREPDCRVPAAANGPELFRAGRSGTRKSAPPVPVAQCLPWSEGRFGWLGGGCGGWCVSS